jgi:aldehyde:ferredoxin oxidoreductase
MPYGYHGKILHVDLTSGQLSVEEPPEAFYRKYLGGSAMGLTYLLKAMPAGADPLGPDNVLTLFASALTGAPISGQSRLTVNAKSPLSGGIGDSQMGGFFPAELKFAGFDGIVVRGRAAQPVYLWIHDGQAELRPAGQLWGKLTGEVDALIRQELGDEKIEIAQAGPAGEKGVRFAAIMNMSNRAAGRTGMGAVMASKNLKAVAVRGKARPKLADAAALNALAKWGAGNLEANGDMQGLKLYGTASVLNYQNATGTLPTFNYNAGQFENAEKISGETMADTILKDRDTCYACTVHCKRVVETQYAGRAVEPRYGGPEYETLSTFGSYCGIDDLPAVALANQLCNQYGVDTIACGATIAWAMECFAQGVLSEAEIGFPLRFGDADAMLRALEMLLRREGFGDVLAEGSAGAARRLGKGEEFLITVKGGEAPAHMPQAKRSLGLIYAVNPFGADHQSSEHDPMIEEGAADLYRARTAEIGFTEMLPPYSLSPEKVRFALVSEWFYSFLDSATLCQFVFGPAWTLYGPEQTAAAVRAITGWEDFTVDELLRVGERRLNLLRAFNAREGFGRKDDKLPKKFFQALQGGGPTGGVALSAGQIDGAIDEYYRLAGWTADGQPTPEKLAALALDWVSAG